MTAERPMPESRARAALAVVKTIHTVVWTFFVACIAGIPIVSWRGEHVVAAWLVGIVCVEVVVLASFGGKCPLTAVAARFTADRRANFDIYLPEWLARHNKGVFGTLFVVGVIFAATRWLSS